MAVASAGLYANTCTSLQTDNHTNTPSLNFYRQDAFPDAQPTVSKHWKQSVINKKAKKLKRHADIAVANVYRPGKSHASHVRLTHFRWVSRSHSTQWKSHAFSCSTKNNIFNVTSVLLLWWEMRVLTPVLLLLTLGLLIFVCGSIRHTAQWQSAWSESNSKKCHPPKKKIEPHYLGKMTLVISC